ncbi:MAG: damage-control phosphatase, subfamily [Methanobacteriaceae archaeon]|nr:damage-control phosphatase, subfamily [Methanobacteriaceae archaeon]
MRVYYECAPCFLRQAREALDLATDDEKLKLKIMRKIIGLLDSMFKEGAVSNEIGTAIHRLIKEMTGNKDPYANEKRRCNKIAQNFLPIARKFLKDHENLEDFVKVAITGNIIDFGALGLDFDHEKVVMESLNSPLQVNHTRILEENLKKSKRVLYLADNTGEIIFDKLLIEKLLDYDVNVTVAVKDEPILNDACIDDALEAGLNKIADIVTTGTDSVGVIYHEFSDEFKEVFDNSQIIIAKGLGNYEGLTEAPLDKKPVFCLLNAKCTAIAKDIGVEVGSNVMIKIA